MKKGRIAKHTPPPVMPTAQQALAKVVAELRYRGAVLPMPTVVENVFIKGLCAALAAVEEEIETLSAAAARDNPAHRALFSLPPIQASASTDVALPEMPAQKTVTGDVEVDAVLWLREVIGTGQADLIEKARQAALKIKTPLKVLEKRYTDYLTRANPGNWVAAMASIGFADLDGLATSSVTSAARRREAEARFGNALFSPTMAEEVCEGALFGLKRKGPFLGFDKAQVDKRFDALEAERPGTLTDCILELGYWDELYRLRRAVDSDCIDHSPEVNARCDYVFRMLSRIRPRDPEEAAAVLRYLASADGMDRPQTGAILMNLVGAPEPYHPHEYGGDHA